LKSKHTLSALGLVLSGLGGTPQAWAQDVFQTGETDRDYNYFQAVYLINETVDFPLLFNLNVSVHPDFTFLAEYSNLSVRNSPIVNDVEVSVKQEAESAEIGFGYHRASQRWDKIDWLASLQYRLIKFTYTVNEEKFTAEADALVLDLGLRASLTPKLEAQAVIATSYSDQEIQRQELDLTSVYRVLAHFDIALGARNVTQAATYNIGFRYSW